MANTVRYIHAVGIHGMYDLELEFYRDVNILYGKNGSGKTTLLHILANILNANFERFAFLPFETIEVRLDNNQRIKLREYADSEGNKIDVSLNKDDIASFAVSEVKQRLWSGSSSTRRPILPTAYFPAFRTLIEASGQEENASRYQGRELGEAKAVQGPNAIDPMDFARKFFGDFVPFLNYPSLQEVSRRLSAEILDVVYNIAGLNVQMLSEAFLDIFVTLSKESHTDVTQLDQVLERTRLLLLESTPVINDPAISEEVYTQLRKLVPGVKVRPKKEDAYVPILEVYRGSLEERSKIQAQSLKVVNTYLNSVNRFLGDKQLILRKEWPTAFPTIFVKLRDTNFYSGIQALSAGERQIITLLYSATHMNGQRVVLVDEPEISLHVDWQHLLISEMVAQLGDVQIITSTHSPMIGGNEYEDQLIEVKRKLTGGSGPNYLQQS